MLKVECESCKAPYQVDERRVPLAGLKMRCPKCGHTFLVTDPLKGSAPPAVGGAPVARPQMKQTMVGVGAFNAVPQKAAKPAAQPMAAAVPPPPAPPLEFGFGLDGLDDDFLALPAVKAPVPKVAARAGLAAAPVAPPAPAPPSPSPFALPGLDDLDLPALASDVGLPAAVDRSRRVAPKPSQPNPSPPKVAPPAFTFDVDLPALGGSRSSGAGAFGSLDLPALPSRPPSVAAAPSSSKRSAGGFGSFDLPTAKGRAEVPNDLPRLGGQGLPKVASGRQNVAPPPPSTPFGGFGEIDLPSVQNDLPLPAGEQAHMPVPVSDDRLLPNRMGALPAPLAFGELDLPSVGAGALFGENFSSTSASADALSFGALDLPPEPSAAGGPASAGRRATGEHKPEPHTALGFGEVDLGGDTSGGQVVGPPPATSAGSMFQEASLDDGAPQGPATSASARARVTEPEAPIARAPKILAALVALVVVGGAALQFTPLGAFGYVSISDKLHAGDYGRDAVRSADAARVKLGADTYASAQQAADELAELRRRSPRNRPLAAYAAYVEFANQVRFGSDATRVARAKTFLSDVPPGSTEPFFVAAMAAQMAATGEAAAARPAASAAASAAVNEGLRLDLALLRGELALAERDYPAALQAFGDAAKAGPGARAQFGLARALYATKALSNAKEAVDATLTASPNHAGARSLRAVLSMELERNPESALKDLAVVLDPVARKSEAANEISTAAAARGWIMLALDRAGDARAAFDEAVSVDPRNVTALVGQGEVLYADGRYTEALTRFDEAVQKDPTGLASVVGAAKTKIALERLADAKAQITAARTRVPKDMALALWLARAEEALGNKAVAEKLYGEAVELADPQDPNAILAFAANAAFLASQGRPSDAQATLDQARVKLADTAILQRAFGDVAATQGHFDEALGHYESALRKSPTDLGTRFRLGVTYRRMNRMDQAAKEFDQIVAVDKEYPNIALERGLLFEKSNDLSKALEQFNSALAKQPKDVDLMMRVGAAYVSIGEVEKALPLLNKVKDLRPNSAEANHYIGRAYLKQGGLESAAAMRYLKRAVELDPNKAEFHLYVAWAANESVPAQLGLARTHVEKALTLDRLLADGYWQRGIVLLREGAVNDALVDLKHALELKPSRHEAHAALAEAFEQKNDVASAMAEWSKAIAGDDRVPIWHFRYGVLLLEKNRTADAAKHLASAVVEGRKALPRPGWLGRAAFEAGEAQRKSGQKPAAVESYRTFLDFASSNDPNRRDALRALKDLGAPYEH